MGRARSRCSWTRRPAPTSATSTATSTSTSASATPARWPATAPPPRSPPSSASSAAGSPTCCRPRTRSSPADELRRRFGLRYWQFTLTATDANRFAIRLARHITGRPKILVHNHNYHGSVDETFAWIGPDGGVVARRGNIGAPVPPSETTRVVEINDLDALERELAHGDVAVALVRAGADQRRHRAPRPRLPRGGPRADAQARDAADHRRDAHDLRRPGRLHGRPRPRARHPHDRQDDRRRDPGRRLRVHRGGRRADRAPASPGRTRTSAASAARWPATRCRWRRSGRR